MNTHHQTNRVRPTVLIAIAAGYRNENGAWAAYLQTGYLPRGLRKPYTKLIGGRAENTTSQRVELLAAIGALSALKQPCVVKLTTASNYVRLGILEWLPQWKANGWKGSKRAPVRNKDLWMQLDELLQQHEVGVDTPDKIGAANTIACVGNIVKKALSG